MVYYASLHLPLTRPSGYGTALSFGPSLAPGSAGLVASRFRRRCSGSGNLTILYLGTGRYRLLPDTRGRASISQASAVVCVACTVTRYNRGQVSQGGSPPSGPTSGDERSWRVHTAVVVVGLYFGTGVDLFCGNARATLERVPCRGSAVLWRPALTDPT